MGKVGKKKSSNDSSKVEKSRLYRVYGNKLIAAGDRRYVNRDLPGRARSGHVTATLMFRVLRSVSLYVSIIVTMPRFKPRTYSFGALLRSQSPGGRAREGRRVDFTGSGRRNPPRAAVMCSYHYTRQLHPRAPADRSRLQP
ncbi:hypothetical protein EVAR_80509_1 [Eumeta japonica]|uniref:Uncharacterized protein n=1 Tax=Eumeta variegata TaxID=151549 RepID=A0A4C1TNM2_EUMVA|nr:hypothetical protein EVAR_80509_1 [Eumeta japonica]